MGLRLLLDEDTQSKTLVRLLVEEGHDVVTVAAAGMNGASDQDVFRFGQADSCMILTRNTGDFLSIHQQQPEHRGILAIYQEAEMAKNMSYPEIIRAIANLVAASVSLEGQFLALNAWRY